MAKHGLMTILCFLVMVFLVLPGAHATIEDKVDYAKLLSEARLETERLRWELQKAFHHLERYAQIYKMRKTLYEIHPKGISEEEYLKAMLDYELAALAIDENKTKITESAAAVELYVTRSQGLKKKEEIVAVAKREKALWEAHLDVSKVQYKESEATLSYQKRIFEIYNTLYTKQATSIEEWTVKRDDWKTAVTGVAQAKKIVEESESAVKYAQELVAEASR